MDCTVRSLCTSPPRFSARHPSGIPVRLMAGPSSESALKIVRSSIAVDPDLDRGEWPLVPDNFQPARPAPTAGCAQLTPLPPGRICWIRLRINHSDDVKHGQLQSKTRTEVKRSIADRGGEAC